MPRRPKTGFDKFVEEQMKDERFAADHAAAKRAILAVDQIVRALDTARLDLGMSKAELARRISTKPEVVRRLFTEGGANPTMATVVKIAHALNLRVEVVPARSPKTSHRAKQATSTETTA